MIQLCRNRGNAFVWHIIENFLDIEMCYFEMFHTIIAIPEWSWDLG